MSHLPTERLAALADDPPTTAELAHLASCRDCARERAAYQSLHVLAAAESARIGAPLTSWERLAPALATDGVIDGGTRGAARRGDGRWGGRRWFQAAATIVLVAGGIAAGRYSAGAALLPFHAGMRLASSAAGQSVTAADTTDSSSATALPSFQSVDDARTAQMQAQATYQAATAFLAQNDSTTHVPNTPAGMRTRLAALDRTRAVLDQALSKAPYDPVINGYYLNTLGQREATLRQLNTMLPVGMRITSY